MKRFGKMVLAGVILSILAVNFCSAKDKEVQEDTTEDLTQEVCSDGKEHAAVKGTVKMPVFMVDFPDNRFKEGALTSENFAFQRKSEQYDYICKGYFQFTASAKWRCFLLYCQV